MRVQLEKDGIEREYNIGSAYYLLLNFIPAIGWLITITLMIIRKQFKGIFLNQFVVALIGSLIYSVILSMYSATGSTTIAAISMLFGFALMIISLVMYVMYILKANLYSVKQLLEDGYTVTNGDDMRVADFVEQAKATKKPFWQLLKF